MNPSALSPDQIELQARARELAAGPVAARAAEVDRTEQYPWDNVELLKDAAVALAPVTVDEAKAMLGKLKGKAVLTGFRGSEPVDLDKLADVIVRLGEFISDQKDIVAELDVNPLICSGGRIMAVDALIVRS